MPRRTTLAARESLLFDLKNEKVVIRDRDNKIAEVNRQIDMATKANFPKSALDALAAERKRIEEVGLDPKLDEKIDILERWVTAEKAFQNTFGAVPQRPRQTGVKRVGRPRKNSK